MKRNQPSEIGPIPLIKVALTRSKPYSIYKLRYIYILPRIYDSTGNI